MTTRAQNFAIFQFPDTMQDVRIIDREGNPWFVAIDVCRILGLTHVTEALKTLDKSDKLQHAGSIGRGRRPLIISESGLYTLIMRSNKPQAKRLRLWVTKKVLPSIRKTGSYSMMGDEQPSNASATLEGIGPASSMDRVETLYAGDDPQLMSLLERIVGLLEVRSQHRYAGEASTPMPTKNTQTVPHKVTEENRPCEEQRMTVRQWLGRGVSKGLAQKIGWEATGLCVKRGIPVISSNGYGPYTKGANMYPVSIIEEVFKSYQVMEA